MPLAVLGLAESAWGVVTFARDSVPVPRVALGVALAPLGVWAGMLAASTAPNTFSLLPLAIAMVFEVFLAIVLARHLRRRADAAAPAAPGVTRYLLGVIAGGPVVAALTTPALAATRAGLAAQPHGTYQTTNDLFGHGH